MMVESVVKKAIACLQRSSILPFFIFLDYDAELCLYLYSLNPD
jgi:hypothetical protein